MANATKVVKVFSKTAHKDLENAINEYLENTYLTLLEIQYSSAFATRSVTYSALLLLLK